MADKISNQKELENDFVEITKSVRDKIQRDIRLSGINHICGCSCANLELEKFKIILNSNIFKTIIKLSVLKVQLEEKYSDTEDFKLIDDLVIQIIEDVHNLINSKF